MRLFLFWADRGVSPELGKLMAELTHHGHEILYWVGQPEGTAFKPTGTIFHSYRDSVLGIPAEGIDITEFAPPSDDIIRQFYKTESILLTMMNRAFDGWCVDQRRHLYYEMLRYWYGVIKKYSPEAMVFPVVPHGPDDYLAFELARFFNIKTIVFDDTRFPGRLLPFNDFWIGSEELRVEFKKNENENFSVQDLSDDIRSYYAARSGAKQNIVPEYIKAQKKKYSIWHWLRSEPKIIASLKDLSVIYKAPRYVFSSIKLRGVGVVVKPFVSFSYLFRNNLKREYASVQVEPDLNKKFVYVPLQKQPERTTSPQGDMFVDQILMLEMLSASLPGDWMIYVKEHPLQWMHWGVQFSSYRYRGYYEKIAKIKNVRLIAPEIASYPLIDRSEAVAAVTGSAGWEAVMRGKSAVIFGRVWYVDCPGVFNVGNVDECRNALNKIADGFKPDKQKFINYLKSFDDVTLRGQVSHTSAIGSLVTKQESMKNITQAILKELANQ